MSWGVDVGDVDPEDLCIVQIGDLVGRYVPASEQIVEIVDALRKNNPGPWVQLMGNWEVRELDHGFPFRSRSEDQSQSLSRQHLDMMASWWDEPGGSVAAVIRARAAMPYLATQAGVTRTLWADLGEPGLDETAALLNALVWNRRLGPQWEYSI